ERLMNGCKFCHIEPKFNIEEIKSMIITYIAKSKNKNLYIRPIIYLSDPPEGIVSQHNNTFEIYFTPIDTFLSKKHSINVGISNEIRSYPNMHMQCKNSANYLTAQMGKLWAKKHKFDDVII